jgi:hypothetical protein
MKGAHLPQSGLLKLFGIDMAKLINPRRQRDDSNIIRDPARMLPFRMQAKYIPGVSFSEQELRHPGKRT